jgi:hypothetical protein
VSRTDHERARTWDMPSYRRGRGRLRRVLVLPAPAAEGESRRNETNEAIEREIEAALKRFGTATPGRTAFIPVIRLHTKVETSR